MKERINKTNEGRKKAVNWVHCRKTHEEESVRDAVSSSTAQFPKLMVHGPRMVREKIFEVALHVQGKSDLSPSH
jgi:hypothetical protein